MARNGKTEGALLCAARCPKVIDKKTCGRRCCKAPGHVLTRHRCLAHGAF